ncbi:hypothetical protein HMPREF3214_01679 [Alloscardovia omnicolens]|nr:hypothetical protein HMPREF3214_01679 [Alloscardovia omnicolens]
MRFYCFDFCLFASRTSITGEERGKNSLRKTHISTTYFCRNGRQGQVDFMLLRGRYWVKRLSFIV